jgi:prophage DNA circulation protein
MDNKQILSILKYAANQEVLDYDPDETDSLHSEMFADTINRKYPVHKRAAVHTSIIEFMDSGDTRKYVLDRLIKAAGVHNMQPLQKLADVKTINFKITSDAGQAIYSAYINSPASLQKVAASLVACKYPYHVRKRAAMDLLNVAEKLNLDISEDIHSKLEKTAGLGAATLEHVRTVVNKRAASMSSWSMREVSDMVKASADNIHEVDGYVSESDMHKLASVLDAADHYFKTSYDNVEQELYQHTMSDIYKVACDMLPMSNGAILSKRAVIENKQRLEPLFKAAGIEAADDTSVISTIAAADKHLADAIEKLF